MKICSIDKVRNFAILGHAGAAKTALAELMLFKAGAISKRGTVADKNTVSDYRKEEQERASSVYSSVMNCVWNNHVFFFTDNPGYADFCGEACSATEAADMALIVIDAVDGIGPGTTRAWRMAEEDNVPRAFFINGAAKDQAKYHDIMDMLKKTYGEMRVIPMVIPVGVASEFTKVIHILRTPEAEIPAAYIDEVKKDRQMLLDAIAEADEALMERYLNGEALSDEDISRGLHKAIGCGEIIPVFCGSVIKDIGITELMNGVVNLFPSGEYVVPFELEDGTLVSRDPNDPDGIAWVFKTVTDPHMGQISYLKIISGTWHSHSEVYNATRGQSERLGIIGVPFGKSQEEIDAAIPGAIIAVTKLKNTQLGDMLSLKAGSSRKGPKLHYPQPPMVQAVKSAAKGEEEKLAAGIAKLCLEDPTLRFERHPETNEELLYGMGDQHFNIVRQRLKSDAKLDVIFQTPKIPYRETISGNASASYRHKKQSGGHGQFAEVHLKVEPLEDGFEFVNAVVGGVIPKNYIPAVEKGVIEAMEHGPLAHCRVINMKVTVYDGKDHPVDSSEMAFKIASRMAFREAMRQAKPILLEPIKKIKVYIPEMYMGDITGDLNTRRARILGMGSEDGMQTVEAEIPTAETFTYATQLRSMTQGKGYFEIEPLRYDVVPAALAAKIQKEMAELTEKDPDA